MIHGFEFRDVNLSSWDVSKLVEFFSKKFNVQKEITWQYDQTAHESDIETQSEEESARTKPYGRRGKRHQRRYKDYQHQDSLRVKTDNPDLDKFRTIRQTVDIKFCPTCSKPLADRHNEYTRKSEDVLDGRWTITEWTINRRYCKHCRRQYATAIPGVLRDGHFGTTIMAQIFVMRSLAISYEKIQAVIYVLFDRSITITAIMSIYKTVAKQCEPLYDELVGTIKRIDMIFGDETGWFLDERYWWVWVFITSHTVLLHTSPPSRKMVTEAILEGFNGITVGDSQASRSHTDVEKHRSLMHYFSEMCSTLYNNNSSEYKQLLTEMHCILRDAIGLWGEYQKAPIPGPDIQSLQNRIDSLADVQYTDSDCKRYAKRLRDEDGRLLTFLKHNNHDNIIEHALQIFVLMRNICYGSRSSGSVKNAEILVTIYTTCSIRDVNPYYFMKDHLDGKMDTIPSP